MIQGIITIIFLIGFIVICIWAFSPKNKKRFEKDANIPFINNNKNSKHKTVKKRHD